VTLEELDREDGVVVRCLRNIGPYENNIFVVSDEASREAYIIDGGYEPEQVAEAARDLNVRSILVTHGHTDHHEHVRELRELLNRTRVGIGIDDAAMLSVEADDLIVDQQAFNLGGGGRALRAIHTPGHTPGSTCFLIGKHLFTGDTLFPGGPGNTQRDVARFERIIGSIRDRLFTLPEDTIVHPGHGRDTTIGAEKPQLDEWIARGW
jgi:glyoxylase-like metal-dependent hydrolase (beta-lactamase superfamily II)